MVMGGEKVVYPNRTTWRDCGAMNDARGRVVLLLLVGG